MQGHPEYDASSLLLEYRRDVRRWLEESALDPPRLPTSCAAPPDMRRLEDYQGAILAGKPSATPDFLAIAQRAPAPWRPHAHRIYHNWLRSISSKDRTSVA
jgi:homoserine O-succinyltransferase